MKKKEKKNRITTLDAVIIIVVIFLISAAVPLAISRCAVPNLQHFKAEITLDGRSVEVNVSPEGRIAPVKCWPLTLKGGKSGVGSGKYIYVFDFADFVRHGKFCAFRKIKFIVVFCIIKVTCNSLGQIKFKGICVERKFKNKACFVRKLRFVFADCIRYGKIILPF